jgi:hypothetical protein
LRAWLSTWTRGSRRNAAARIAATARREPLSTTRTSTSSPLASAAASTARTAVTVIDQSSYVGMLT